jgi:hypothetical protein
MTKDRHDLFDEVTLDGLKMERRPKQQLAKLMNVPISQLGPDGTMQPLRKTRKQPHQIIEKLLQSNANRERIEAGMNPATLLAENRRKLILKTLASEVDNEDSSQLSVRDNATVDILTPGREDSIDDDATSLGSFRTFKTLKTASTAATLAKLGVDPASRQFKPNWGHYNTMRSRWKYVQPQVKHLVDEEEMFAPVTVQNFVTIGKRTLVGNINDVNSFLHQEQSLMDRSKSVLSGSMVLVQQKKEQDARHYVPMHSVRWGHPKEPPPRHCVN